MEESSPKIILATACIIFFCFGIFLASIGPVLSELAAQTASSLAVVGSIFTALFLGALIAQIIAGPLTDRFGQRRVLYISLLILMGGILGFSYVRSLPRMLALAFIAGVGQGGVDLGCNILVAAAYPNKNTSALNLLHFFFGFGSFLGPTLVVLLLKIAGKGISIFWISAVTFFMLAIVVYALKITQEEKSSQGFATERGSGQLHNIYLSPLVWLLGILLLIYVGVEFGIGQWITTYLNLTNGMILQSTALVTSAYWGLLTLGRLVGALMGSRVKRLTLLLLCLGGSLMGGVLFAIAGGAKILSIVALMIIGFSFGAIYPTTIAIASAVYKDGAGKAVSVLTALGSVGGLAFPVLVGFLLEDVSPFATTLFFVGSLFVMLLLLGPIWISTIKFEK